MPTTGSREGRLVVHGDQLIDVFWSWIHNHWWLEAMIDDQLIDDESGCASWGHISFCMGTQQTAMRDTRATPVGGRSRSVQDPNKLKELTRGQLRLAKSSARSNQGFLQLPAWVSANGVLKDFMIIFHQHFDTKCWWNIRISEENNVLIGLQLVDTQAWSCRRPWSNSQKRLESPSNESNQGLL